MKKLAFFVFVLALASLVCRAEMPYIVEDGVRYYILESEHYAIATSPADPAQSSAGTIVVKESVEYNNVEYPVTCYWGYEWLREGQKICLPEGLETIEGYSSGAVMDYIPQSLEHAMRYSFYYVTLPENISLPNIRTIGPYAFTESNVRRITIGPRVSKLGYPAFGDNVCDLIFEEGEPDEPLRLLWRSFGCKSLTELKLPRRNSMYISDCFVPKGDNLVRVVFPEVDEITYAGAAAMTELSLIIPIKGYWIEVGPKFREVVCLGTVPPEITNLELIDSYTFSEATEFNITDNNDQCVLKVPAGSEDLYKMHPIWGKFRNICGFEGGDYTSVVAPEGESVDNGLPVYYNLQGMEVKNPVKGGVYIRRTGATVSKIVY